MKQYKHKQTGIIGELLEDGHLHFKRSGGECSCEETIWKGFIENSNDWEEVVEKEYEILSVLSGSNQIWQKRDVDSHAFFSPTGYTWVFIDNFGTNWRIHSVKRLSDGEVFTLGDLIDFVDFGNKGVRPIERFEVDCFDNLRITAYDGPYGMGFQKWKKVNKPLFTAQDGKQVYKGDEIHFVDEKFIYGSGKACDTDIRQSYKHFSSKALAEEYILMNKPMFSINEILESDLCKFIKMFKGDYSGKLIELAKNKISNP